MEKIQSNINFQKTSQTHKLRVGIRGVSGQLGARICAAVNSQPDMMVTLGIGRKDQSFSEHFLFSYFPANNNHSVLRKLEGKIWRVGLFFIFN